MTEGMNGGGGGLGFPERCRYTSTHCHVTVAQVQSAKSLGSVLTKGESYVDDIIVKPLQDQWENAENINECSSFQIEIIYIKCNTVFSQGTYF